VDPKGQEFARYRPHDYLNHVAEHVETWTYMKFPYLKKIGWHGMVDGAASGVYRVSLGMLMPLIACRHQSAVEFERMNEYCGGRPVQPPWPTGRASLR
jgi:F420-non-reducing hydrogenase large subunit